MTARLRVLLLALVLAFCAAPVLAQQDSAQQIQSLQTQAERTRANAAEYRNNVEAYRRLSREAQEQAQRADEALALAIARGNEESRSYWERQAKFWRERMELHKEEIARHEAKAAELESAAGELEAQAAKLRAAAVAPPPPPAPSPAPAAASAPESKPDKYRRLDLSDFVGLWRDKDNNVEGVIEGTDPKDPTVGTQARFKGRKLTWEGELEDGGGEKPSRLVFRYKPKWQEMNEEIPDWARRKVEGQLEWKLVLQQPDDEFACVLPTLEATWNAGEVTWEGDAGSGTAEVTGEGDAQEFSLDKEDDELELHGYFSPALLLHIGDPQRAMTDPVVFLVQGQRFHVEVHMSKEAARAHSPTAGSPNLLQTYDDAGINWVFERDYGGAPATVVFRGLTSGKTAKLDLGMALQTRNHPVVRYETRAPVAITDLWGVENKINVEFDDGETVEASFGAARQQFRFFTSATKAKLAARDEDFQKTAYMINAILAGAGRSMAQRQQADNVLKLVRNARAFIHDVPVYLNESSELHGLNDRARLAIVDKYYQDIVFGKHTRWFGQNGFMASPDNPFGVRWASAEEMEMVLAVMKSAERAREVTAMTQESVKAGAHASVGLYTTVSYAGLAIAFHATPIGEAYLAWYGEDLYGNRVDWTERVGAALGFSVSVATLTSTMASALNAVRDMNRVYAVEKAAEVQSLVEAAAGGAAGERRVISGAEAARPPASGPGAVPRRVLRSDQSSEAGLCVAETQSYADLLPDALNAAERIAARGAGRPLPPARPARDLTRAKGAHPNAEILAAPEDLHPYLQSGNECRMRSLDALEQMQRRHPVNPRANTNWAQTRRTEIDVPGGGKAWKVGQGGASTEQVSAYAASDLRARHYNFDLPLADVAELHESGFGVTLALELTGGRHQVALYAVEYGRLGRFLRRPKSFTIFDTNYPSHLFKYKACDLDRLLMRGLRPGETRRVGSSLISYTNGSHEGRTQYFVDLFQFR